MAKYCRSCNNYIDSYHCKRCLMGPCCGCNCTQCDNCNKHVGMGHMCQMCRKCRHKPSSPRYVGMTCVCRNKPSMRIYHQDTTYHLNKLKRLLGTEVECANWGNFTKEYLNSHARFFSGHFTRDGSVVPSALELVLNPLTGDAFLRGMNELAYILCDTGATVNNTCGFHVHVDGTDLNYFALRNLIHLYSALEPSIFELVVQRARYDNTRYCIPFNQCFGDLTKKLEPCVTTHDIKAVLMQELYNVTIPTSALAYGLDSAAFAKAKVRAIRTFRERTGNKYPPDAFRNVRYNAFNLHSWFFRGTVEFRMFEGTINLHDLVFWPLFCGWMVELAYTKTYKEIQTIANMHTFLRVVPPPIKTWAVTRMRNVELGEIL